MSYIRTMPARIWRSIDLLVIVLAAVMLTWTLVEYRVPATAEAVASTADVMPESAATAVTASSTMLAGPERPLIQDPPDRPRRRRTGDTPRDIPPVLNDGDNEPGRDRALSPAQLDEALRIIADLYPERAERFERLRQRNPEAFERALSQHARGIVGLVWIKERKPDLFEVKVEELRLERQVAQLAQRLATASQGERDAVLESIRQVVSEQVNLSLRVRAMELLMLEEHFRAMREQLQRDSANRQQMIEARVRRIAERAGR